MVVQKERNLYVQGLEAKVTSKTETEEVLAWHTHKGTIEKIMQSERRATKTPEAVPPWFHAQWARKSIMQKLLVVCQLAPQLSGVSSLLKDVGFLIQNLNFIQARFLKHPQQRFFRLEKSGSANFFGWRPRKNVSCITTFLPPSKSLLRVQIKCHFECRLRSYSNSVCTLLITLQPPWLSLITFNDLQLVLNHWASKDLIIFIINTVLTLLELQTPQTIPHLQVFLNKFVPMFQSVRGDGGRAKCASALKIYYLLLL